MPSAAVSDQNGNAASSALLALEEARRAADMEREGDGPVEAPLEDRPEAEGEPDRWLEERGGQDVEKAPDE